MTEPSNRFYRFVYYPLRCIFGLAHPVMRAKGQENIPEGACIFAANHRGIVDPFWVIFGYHPRRLFYSMAKIELFRIPVVRWFIRKLGAFPVDRDGSDVNAIKYAMRMLKNNEKLLIFPEGTRVKKGKVVTAKSGVALLASRMGVPVVPVYLSTKRRFLSPMRVVYGEPYRIETSSRRPSQEELETLTEELMRKIYALGETV